MKKETLEEAAERYATNHGMMAYVFPEKEKSFIDGAKWMQERMCSVEGMRSAWEDGRKFEYDHNGGEGGEFTGAESFEEWFEQFKKK